MRGLPLSQGCVAFVDDRDFERASAFKWSLKRSGKNLYAHRRLGTSSITLHRFLVGLPPGVGKIDHWDGDGLNNQRDNIRVCSPTQNMRNRRPNDNHSSKYKGVGWRKSLGKWYASIRVNGRLIHLGFFRRETSAARAYDAAARKYFDKFCRLNSPL